MKAITNAQHELVFGDAVHYFAWYNAPLWKRFLMWIFREKSDLMSDELKLKQRDTCATIK